MINFRQIEAFREVMRQKTATKAAKALHVSQPAVSRLISDLEYYVGFELFKRQKRQLIPTPEALGLFEEVERSYAGLERIVDTARDIREFRSGRLFICAMPAMSLSLLPTVLHEFTQKHPGVAASLQAHSSQRVMEWVGTQQCDLGFIGMNIDDPTVGQVPVGEGALQLVMRPDHRLNVCDVITPRNLAGQPMICVGQQLDFRPSIERAFNQAGIEMNICLQTQLSSVACELVLAGSGVSLVDPITASAYTGRGLIARSFEPTITLAWHALLPRYRPASRLVSEFIDITRERLAIVLEKAEAQATVP